MLMDAKNTILQTVLVLHTDLKGVDMSTNQIDGLKTDLKSIEGMVVSTEQAIALSKLLKIVIK